MKEDKTKDRTFNPACPSCNAAALHTEFTWKEYHPKNRTGIVDGKAPKKTNPNALD